MVLFIMPSSMGNILMQLVTEQLLYGKLQYYRLLHVHVLPPPHTTNFHVTESVWHFYLLCRASKFFGVQRCVQVILTLYTQYQQTNVEGGGGGGRGVSLRVTVGGTPCM